MRACASRIVTRISSAISGLGLVKNFNDTRCGVYCQSLTCSLRAMGCATEFMRMAAIYKTTCGGEMIDCTKVTRISPSACTTLNT